MTDSRVEAVARAIARAAAKREFGPNYEGYESSHRELGEAFAPVAIEASDAWLVEQVAVEAEKQAQEIDDRHEPEDTDR